MDSGVFKHILAVLNINEIGTQIAAVLFGILVILIAFRILGVFITTLRNNSDKKTTGKDKKLINS